MSRGTCRPGRAASAASILLFGLSLVAALSLSGCSRKGAEKRARPLVGFSMDSFVVERWSRDRDIFMATAQELGADVILQVGEQSADLQETQVQYLIDKGVDVLVIIPNDADRLTKLVLQAKKKGIPVVSYDRLIRNANVDLFISFDSVTVGRLQAEALLRFVPGGKIAIINGASTDANAHMYHEGYMEVLAPHLASGRYTLVWDEWTDAWRSEWATESMRRILAENERIDGVIAANDMLAEAAIKVLAEKRLTKLVPVMGHDAELSACQRIAQGTQSMTVYKPLRELATRAAEYAIQLARGLRAEIQDSINDGTYRVPYYRIEPEPVYAETLESTVIEDGFHAREDVFMDQGRM